MFKTHIRKLETSRLCTNFEKKRVKNDNVINYKAVALTSVFHKETE